MESELMKRNAESWQAFSKSREQASAVASIPVAELVAARRERNRESGMSKRAVYESLGMSRVVGARGGVYYE